MIRLLLLKYYRSIYKKRMFRVKKGKYFYDFYLIYCIWFLSKHFFAVFYPYRKYAKEYACRCCEVY